MGPIPASTLGQPGDGSGDECARPLRYGGAAGVRGAEAVLRGDVPLARERDTGVSELGASGFPVAGPLT